MPTCVFRQDRNSSKELGYPSINPTIYFVPSLFTFLILQPVLQGLLRDHPVQIPHERHSRWLCTFELHEELQVGSSGEKIASLL